MRYERTERNPTALLSKNVSISQEERLRLTSPQRNQGALSQVIVQQVSPEAAPACNHNHVDFVEL